MRRSIDDILNAIKQQLSLLGSEMANFIPYSNLYILFRSIAAIITDQDLLLDELRDTISLTTATGSDLDNLANIYGISRKTGTVANGSVIVYGPSTTIPEGLILSYIPPSTSSGVTYEYQVTKSDIVSSLGTTILSVAATSVGNTFNLSGGTQLTSSLLPLHTFIVGQYRDPITNSYVPGLNNGATPETDYNIRQRILTFIQSKDTTTATSLNKYISNLNYISKYYIVEGAPLRGFVTVYIPSQDYKIKNQLLNDLLNVTPLGLQILVSTINNITTTIAVRVVTTSDTVQSVVTTVKSVLAQYVDHLTLGQPLDITNILALTLGVSNVSDATVISPITNVIPDSMSLVIVDSIDISVQVS